MRFSVPTNPSPQKSKPAAFWAQRLAREWSAQGRSVIFHQEALFPVLCIDVVLLERSREQMSSLELMLLGLLADGVSSVDSIALFTGLSKHRAGSLLDELLHRGLIEQGPAGQRESDLGRMTLESGFLTMRTTRRMLLCALTGRPLPAAAYQLPRLGHAELVNRRSLPAMLLKNADRVPLHSLDDNLLARRAAVNLPDEAIAIEGVMRESAEAICIEVVAAVMSNGGCEHTCELHLPGYNSCIDWLTQEQSIGLLEPLGFSFNREPLQVAAEIEQFFAGAGIQLVGCRLDAWGSPTITLLAAPDDVLASRLLEERLCMQVKTSTTPGVTVSRLWIKAGPNGPRTELLRGRVLTIAAAPGSSIEKRAELMTRLIAMDRRFQRTLNADGEASAPPDAMLAEWQDIGLGVDEAMRLAGLLRLPNLSGLFSEAI
jgi:hypothetical protein